MGSHWPTLVTTAAPNTRSPQCNTCDIDSPWPTNSHYLQTLMVLSAELVFGPQMGTMDGPKPAVTMAAPIHVALKTKLVTMDSP